MAYKRARDPRSYVIYGVAFFFVGIILYNSNLHTSNEKVNQMQPLRSAGIVCMLASALSIFAGLCFWICELSEKNRKQVTPTIQVIAVDEPMPYSTVTVEDHSHDSPPKYEEAAKYSPRSFIKYDHIPPNSPRPFAEFPNPSSSSPQHHLQCANGPSCSPRLYLQFDKTDIPSALSVPVVDDSLKYSPRLTPKFENASKYSPRIMTAHGRAPSPALPGIVEVNEDAGNNNNSDIYYNSNNNSLQVNQLSLPVRTSQL